MGPHGTCAPKVSIVRISLDKFITRTDDSRTYFRPVSILITIIIIILGKNILFSSEAVAEPRI